MTDEAVATCVGLWFDCAPLLWRPRDYEVVFRPLVGADCLRPPTLWDFTRCAVIPISSSRF